MFLSVCCCCCFVTPDKIHDECSMNSKWEDIKDTPYIDDDEDGDGNGDPPISSNHMEMEFLDRKNLSSVSSSVTFQIFKLLEFNLNSRLGCGHVCRQRKCECVVRCGMACCACTKCHMEIMMCPAVGHEYFDFLC